ELVSIYVADDLPELLRRPLPLLSPQEDLDQPVTAPVLAAGEVNYVGEPVVAVVATDRYHAEDVAERIDVTYEPLEAVASLEVARAGGRRVHDDLPDNRAGGSTFARGEVASALQRCEHVLELELRPERSAATP